MGAERKAVAEIELRDARATLAGSAGTGGDTGSSPGAGACGWSFARGGGGSGLPSSFAKNVSITCFAIGAA